MGLVHSMAIHKTTDTEAKDTEKGKSHLGATQESSNRANLFLFADTEAVGNMIIKGRSPHVRHVSRKHRVNLSDRVSFERKVLSYVTSGMKSVWYCLGVLPSQLIFSSCRFGSLCSVDGEEKPSVH